MTTYININGVDYDASALTLPSEGRMFRNAWDTPSGGAITTDLTLAKAIKKAKLDEDRAEALKLLDLEYVIADERRNENANPNSANASKSAVASKKQALRDYPRHSAWTGVSSVSALAALTLADVAPDAFD